MFKFQQIVSIPGLANIWSVSRATFASRKPSKIAYMQIIQLLHTGRENVHQYWLHRCRFHKIIRKNVTLQSVFCSLSTIQFRNIQATAHCDVRRLVHILQIQRLPFDS